MSWQQLHLQCEKSQVELAESLLMEYEALSIMLMDAGDQPLFEPALGMLIPTLSLLLVRLPLLPMPTVFGLPQLKIKIGNVNGWYTINPSNVLMIYGLYQIG